MLSRAKEHFDAINYYHIIDPEGTLPEIERAKKEAEVLNDMPNSFPQWLSFKLIGKAGFALAETEEQQSFMTVLNCMYMKSVEKVYEYLKARGNEPLVQIAA